MNNSRSVFCKICGGEYILEELGVYNDNETGALRYFCGFCGGNEFYLISEVEEDERVFDALERKMETGDHKFYPYPEEKSVQRMPAHGREFHEKGIKKQTAKTETEKKRISELFAGASD